MKTKPEAIIEKFWWNDDRRPAKAVHVAKYPADYSVSTGQIVSTITGRSIVLLSKRRVKNPEPGYEYYEFRLCE